MEKYPHTAPPHHQYHQGNTYNKYTKFTNPEENQPIVWCEKDECVVDHSCPLQSCEETSYRAVKLQQGVSKWTSPRLASCSWTGILGVVGVLRGRGGYIKEPYDCSKFLPVNSHFISSDHSVPILQLMLSSFYYIIHILHQLFQLKDLKFDLKFIVRILQKHKKSVY